MFGQRVEHGPERGAERGEVDAGRREQRRVERRGVDRARVDRDRARDRAVGREIDAEHGEVRHRRGAGQRRAAARALARHARADRAQAEQVALRRGDGADRRVEVDRAEAGHVDRRDARDRQPGQAGQQRDAQVGEPGLGADALRRPARSRRRRRACGRTAGCRSRRPAAPPGSAPPADCVRHDAPSLFAVTGSIAGAGPIVPRTTLASQVHGAAAAPAGATRASRASDEEARQQFPAHQAPLLSRGGRQTRRSASPQCHPPGDLPPRAGRVAAGELASARAPGGACRGACDAPSRRPCGRGARGIDAVRDPSSSERRPVRRRRSVSLPRQRLAWRQRTRTRTPAAPRAQARRQRDERRGARPGRPAGRRRAARLPGAPGARRDDVAGEREPRGSAAALRAGCPTRRRSPPRRACRRPGARAPSRARPSRRGSSVSTRPRAEARSSAPAPSKRASAKTCAAPALAWPAATARPSGSSSTSAATVASRARTSARPSPSHEPSSPPSGLVRTSAIAGLPVRSVATPADSTRPSAQRDRRVGERVGVADRADPRRARAAAGADRRPLKRRLSTAEFAPDAPTATTRPSGSSAPAAPYA